MKQRFVVTVDMPKGFTANLLRLALIGMMIKVLKVVKSDL